ncbi:hypothetical protein [Plantactinospora veratri]
MNVIQAALTGALIGGLYALMATGLSVTWGCCASSTWPTSA